MKKTAFALCASLSLILPALAQSNAAAPSSDAGSTGASKGSGKMKELVQSCRQQVKSQGLTPQSHEMRQAIMDCVVKERPGMANVMKCRMEGMDKGLKPGDDLKAFVKDCVKKG